MRRALRIRSFRALLCAYTLNELGDWLATIALAVLVYDQTGSALATTALFMSTKFLPALVVPALAARVERIPVGRTLGALYVAEAAAFLALALSASAFSLVLVCALAFVDGTLATTGRAVTRAATVAVLEPEGALREGNAALNIGFSVMNVAGPALAGVAIAISGVSVALVLASAIFLAMAILLLATRGLPAGVNDETPWLHRLRDGVSYISRHPVARPLILAQAGLLVLFTMVVPIEVIYAKQTLGAGDAGFAALVAAWGAGLVVGSLVFARVHHRGLVALVMISTLTVAAGYLGMSAAPTLALACAAAVVGGAGNGVQWVGAITALQEAVDASMQTRVAGFFEAVATAMPGLGFVLGGALTAMLSPRAAFAFAGTGVVLVVVAGGVVWRVRSRGAIVARAQPS